MIGSKIVQVVGDKSRELSEKLSEKYRAQLGEELTKREEYIVRREAMLDAREKAIALREQKMASFFLLHKYYVYGSAALLLLGTLGYFGHHRLAQTEQEAVANDRVATPAFAVHGGLPPSSCQDRGRRYYQNIGRYPTLSTGENADAKVAGMCARTNNSAFANINVD